MVPLARYRIALTMETGRMTAREVACAFLSGMPDALSSGTAAIPPPAPNSPFSIPQSVPISAGVNFFRPRNFSIFLPPSA